MITTQQVFFTASRRYSLAKKQSKPIEEEFCPLCKDNIRLKSHQNDFKKHQSTYGHIAFILNVDAKELERETNEFVNKKKKTNANLKIAATTKITFQLTAKQTRCVEKEAFECGINPSKIIHKIINDYYVGKETL